MLHDFTRNSRPGLLVSVRSAEEAAIALAGGADLIDVKEPSRGSLGAAQASVVAEVMNFVAGRVPTSAALGELDKLSTARSAELASMATGLTFAKLGLAGWRGRTDWATQWQRAMAPLPSSLRRVAVAYADWRAAEAPPPEEVLDVGAGLGCAALLVDTWDKSRGTLLDHWPQSRLAEFVTSVRDRGLAIVLAGSLHGRAFVTAARLQPDLVAVRGAACAAGRTGPLCLHRLNDLRQTIFCVCQRADSNSTKARRLEALRSGVNKFS